MRLTVFLLLLIFALSVLGLSIPAHGQAAYPVSLRAMDVNAVQLELPVVFSISGYGEVSTSRGWVAVTLTRGVHQVTVSVFSVRVSTVTLNVSAPLDMVIPCHVAKLTVTLQGALVSSSSAVKGKVRGSGFNASVYAYAGGGSLTANINASRVAVFKQIPEGAVKVLVVDAARKPLAYGVTNLVGNSVLALNAGSFKRVTVQVLDAIGNPVPGATAAAELASNVTDDRGMTEVYVSSQQVTVLNVTLMNVIVYSGRVDVTVKSVNVNATMAPLNLLLLDESGHPLDSQQVTLSWRDWSRSFATDGDGRLQVPELPYGRYVLRVADDAPAINLAFPIRSGVGNLTVLAHKLTVDSTVLGAYMLGFMTLKVTVKVGSFTVKNAAVSAGAATTSTRYGYAFVQIPVGLDPHPFTVITVKAFNMTVKKTVSADANPIVAISTPFTFLPIVLWRLMVYRYRQRRPPLHEV